MVRNSCTNWLIDILDSILYTLVLKKIKKITKCSTCGWFADD